MTGTIETWKVEIQKGKGDYLPTPYSKVEGLVSLDTISEQLPPGAYTTFRTYQKTKALFLEHHLLRLEDSGHQSSANKPIDHRRIRKVTRQILQNLPDAVDYRIRLTWPSNDQNIVFISIEKLIPLPTIGYERGVTIITKYLKRDRPEAKLSNFIHKSLTERQLIGAEINDVLMVNEKDQILEGISSNFFGIKDQSIYTADKEVLPGITRSIVLEEVVSLGTPIVYRPIFLNEIDSLSEAFITSASRGVLPVRKINETMIGALSPGPITASIIDKYQQRVQVSIEEI